MPPAAITSTLAMSLAVLAPNEKIESVFYNGAARELSRQNEITRADF
jgi:hypothetical protein